MKVAIRVDTGEEPDAPAVTVPLSIPVRTTGVSFGETVEPFTASVLKRIWNGIFVYVLVPDGGALTVKVPIENAEPVAIVPLAPWNETTGVPVTPKSSIEPTVLK